MNLRRKLAQRALERQLAYQQHKAQHLRGHEEEVIAAMTKSSQRVRDLLGQFQPIRERRARDRGRQRRAWLDLLF